MRVKCNFCGISYVPEENGDRCPNCGGLYRRTASDDAEIYSDPINDKGWDDDIPVPPRVNPFYEDRVNRRTSVINKFITVIGVFVIVLVGMTGISDITEVKRQYEYSKEEAASYIEYTDITEEDQSMFMSFLYEPEGGSSYRIQVTGFEKRAAEVSIPDGYEMMELTYTIEKTDEGDGYSSQTTFWDIYITPYLKTKSGSYVQPIDYYYEDLLGISSDAVYEQGISSEFRYPEGRLYYIVKEDDTDCISLYFEKRENYETVGIDKVLNLIEEDE